MHPENVHGFKVGDRALVVESGGSFAKGDIIIFEEDDGSSCPYFKRESDGREGCCYYSRLVPAPVVRTAPKVGDRIRMRRAVGGYIRAGQVGTVRSIEGSAYYVEPLDLTGLARGAYWPQVFFSGRSGVDFDIVSIDPVAEAEAELSAAQAKLDAVRKAEAEAKKIKPEDIKGGAVFLSAMGNARLVVGDYCTGFSIVSPGSGFGFPGDGGPKRTSADTAEYMNDFGYTKTPKTLKDFI